MATVDTSFSIPPEPANNNSGTNIPWDELRRSLQRNVYTNPSSISDTSQLSADLRRNSAAVSDLTDKIDRLEKTISIDSTNRTAQQRETEKDLEEAELERKAANDNDGHGLGHRGGSGIFDEEDPNGGNGDGKPNKESSPGLFGTIMGGLGDAGTAALAIAPLAIGGTEGVNVLGKIAQNHDRERAAHGLPPDHGWDSFAAEAGDTLNYAYRGTLNAGLKASHAVGGMLNWVRGSKAGRLTSKALRYAKGNIATDAIMSGFDGYEAWDRLKAGDVTGAGIDAIAALTPWASGAVGAVLGTPADAATGPGGTVGGGAAGLAVGGWLQMGVESINTFRDNDTWFGWKNPLYSGYIPGARPNANTASPNAHPSEVDPNQPSGRYQQPTVRPPIVGGPHGKDVVEVVDSGPDYITVRLADGSVVKKYGEHTRPWRTNNPGDLDYKPWEKKYGAVQGGDYNHDPRQLLGGHHVAVFPNAQSGRAAHKELLFGEGHPYRSLTIEETIRKYAPPNENDTEGYIARVTKEMGVTRSTRLRDLNSRQQDQMVDAMEGVESGLVGREQIISGPTTSVASAQPLSATHSPPTPNTGATLLRQAHGSPPPVIIQQFGGPGGGGNSGGGGRSTPNMAADLPPSGYSTMDVFNNFL